MMNPSHTSYSSSGPQQFPYGAGFGPSPGRQTAIPHPQHQQHHPQQQQFPPQQQPFPPQQQQQGFPGRGQPQFFQQQQPGQRGSLHSPVPNGRPGVINQPGVFQGAEGGPGQAFSAPQFNQPMTANSIPPSVSQNMPQSFQSSTGTPQRPTAAMAAPGQLINPNTPTAQNQQQRQPAPNNQFGAQGQVQNQAQSQGFLPPLSPKSATREKVRVALLLEINSHLLQEIISLQAQGKAGLPSQSDNAAGSPTSAVDPSNPLNSPSDPSKAGGKQQPSAECADCMRRLQANLSYLAAVADRHKRTSVTFPSAPAILTPPQHLKSLADLYKKLNQVFPGALAAVAKQNPTAMAQAQHHNAPKPMANPAGGIF